MNTKVFFILLTAIFALSVCSACSKPDKTAELFKKRCGMCHDLPKPEKYDKKAWDEQVDNMAKRAGLTPEQITAIKGLKK